MAAAAPRVAGRHPELSQQELQTELLPGGVRYDVDGQIARVTLARPFKRNAQTPDMWLRLAEIGAELPASWEDTFCAMARPGVATTHKSINRSMANERSGRVRLSSRRNRVEFCLLQNALPVRQRKKIMTWDTLYYGGRFELSRDDFPAARSAVVGARHFSPTIRVNSCRPPYRYCCGGATFSCAYTKKPLGIRAVFLKVIPIIGYAPCRNRTYNLMIKSHLLCQLS